MAAEINKGTDKGRYLILRQLYKCRVEVRKVCALAIPKQRLHIKEL